MTIGQASTDYSGIARLVRSMETEIHGMSRMNSITKDRSHTEIGRNTNTSGIRSWSRFSRNRIIANEGLTKVQ